MNERLMAFRIGVTVLATVLAASILILILGPQADFVNVLQLNHKYTVQIEFAEAPGVRENTPILKSGIVIGRVASIELVDQGRKAMIVARIDEKIKLFDDEICRINRSLLGDSELVFIKVPGQGSGVEIELDGTPLQGIVVPDPIQVVGDIQGDLSKAINSVTEIGGKIGSVIDKVDLVLGSDQEVLDARDRVRAMLERGAGAMEAVEELANSVNQVIGDPQTQQDLREALAQIPQMIQSIQTGFDGLNGTLQLADNNLRNLEGFTEALNEQGVQILENANSFTERLDLTMEEVRLFSTSLNSSKGSLGKFINDPELYDSATRMVKNLEELTPQIRSIVYDVKVITDGMARHPGSILREAVKRGPGTKGVPPMSRLRPQVELR